MYKIQILKNLETLANEIPYIAENSDLLVRCQMRIGHWTNRLYDIDTKLDVRNF